MDNYKVKENFVNDYLRPALFSANSSISDVSYSVTENPFKEIVTIMYRSGKKRINVTADSLIALMYDVTKALL